MCLKNLNASVPYYLSTEILSCFKVKDLSFLNDYT